MKNWIFLEVGILIGNWMGSRLLQVYAYEDEHLLRINKVKIKTILLKSNNFFKVFSDNEGISEENDGAGDRECLLTNDFELFFRGLESLFFFHIEPPSGGCFLHQGIDMTHSEQVPGALELAAEGGLECAQAHGKTAVRVFHVVPIAGRHE